MADLKIPDWLSRRRVELAVAFCAGMLVAAILGGPYDYRLRGTHGQLVWRLNKWTGSAAVCRMDDFYNVDCSPKPKPRKVAAIARPASVQMTQRSFTLEEANDPDFEEKHLTPPVGRTISDAEFFSPNLGSMPAPPKAGNAAPSRSGKE